jgi:RHS repeat-associated protein
VIDNNTGAVQDAITYDSYGNITNQTNPAYLGRYAWTGREFDVETDLQYNRARYYDPSTGRWMSQDPLGFDAGDSNLYRYVKNRPTEATDPSGQEWTQDEVQQLLKDTKGGAAILAALNKYTVYRVEFIKFQFKERANIGEAWPKTWKTDYTKGLELDAQDTPDKKANIYIPNKVVDTFLGRKDPPNLMDMSAASAAMAIVHEVAHAQQDPKASSKDREVGAFTAQAEFLINNPDFRRMLPAAERDSYNKLIKKVDGKEVPDKQAIVQLWIKVYNKFAVVGEKNAKRETLSITKEPETNWELGDPKKKIKLENWK